jgi:DNA-binding NarL/FixJ family response regulator
LDTLAGKETVTGNNMTQVDRCAVRNLPLRAESETRIRLVLVEDHAILRDGVRALLELESDVVIVGDFDGIESSLDGIRQLQPDVVVLDLALPNGSGIELLREIGPLSPQSRKLVLTGSDGEANIRAAMSAGADGYVLKDASSAELMLAIRTVSIGQRFLCKAIASKVLLGFLSGDRQPPSPIPASSITVREREVLVRIAQGQSNKVIARDLGLSPKTVEKHRGNMMRKLQLHSAAAITMYAIRNGLDGGDPAGILAASELAAPAQ